MERHAAYADISCGDGGAHAIAEFLYECADVHGRLFDIDNTAMADAVGRNLALDLYIGEGSVRQILLGCNGQDA